MKSFKFILAVLLLTAATNSIAEGQGEKQLTEPAAKARSVRVVFEASGLTDPKELLIRLQEEGVVKSDQFLDPTTANKAVTVVKNFLQARGYMSAEVEVLNDYDARQIKFVIEQGKRSQLREVKFVGNRIFSANTLEKSLMDCLSKMDSASKDFNQDRFDFCVREVSNLMRDRGYLMAHLGEPKQEVNESGLTITLPVSEGRRYQYGEFKIEGATVFTREEILGLFNHKRGEIASGDEIGRWLFEDLKKEYGRRGYIQYMAEPTPEFVNSENKEEGVVDLTVTIEEGRRFVVNGIEFSGKNLPLDQIQNLILLHKGDVYNQESLEKSIRILNETNWFEPIDLDKDTDFRTDDEDALVSLVVKLTLRQTK